MSLSSNEILIGNASVYTLTLLIYYIKNKSFNVGAFLLSLYAITAWASVLFYNHKWFVGSIHDSQMTIEPFVYLYVVLMLFFYPFLKYNGNEITSIEVPNSAKFNLIVKTFTLLQIFVILILLPSVQNVINSTSLSDSRDLVYGESILWFNNISLLNQIFNYVIGLMPISFGLSFYAFFIMPNKNHWHRIYFFSTILLNVVNGFAIVSRSETLFLILVLACLFLLFRNFLSKEKVNKVKKWTLIIIIPFILFFIAVSQSRFGDLTNFMLYKYAGENYINFNGLMYHNLNGTTNGEAYFPLVKRFLGEKEHRTIAHEKWDFIETETDVPGYIFYTFAGALCFEFGKLGVFMIAVVFSLIAGRILKNTDSISITKLLFFSVCIYMLVCGIFLFKLQGLQGNLSIFFMILLMIYFKVGKSEEVIISSEN